MSSSTTVPTKKLYPAEKLTKMAAQLAWVAGVPTEDANILADSLVQADLSGTSTHGLSRLPIYLKRIFKRLIDPKAELKIDRQRAGTLHVDAGNGLGQVQAMKVLDKLIPMARTCGTAAATIRNSQHFGAVSYYCNKAADQGMILLAMTNCEPAMSPTGGTQPFFGTNPIATSFPTGKGFHIKIDLATSIVARGNIIAAQKKGEAIPLGWAQDPEGNPTTDASKALLGTVLTMAGHKGYALAMMVEGFSSVLSGAAVGSGIGSMYKDMERKQDVGHFFALFDIEAFMDLSEFKKRMDATIDQLKGMKKASGVEEILLPGERSNRKITQNKKHGVSIDPATTAELVALCQQHGIECPLS
ncbi:MAG TPA: Ldh family oxidoreductase [Tepidisphaeraceae bacterium]|jgi:LDH2 family malate/lactate/ureidoglycolate dehydrogenase